MHERELATKLEHDKRCALHHTVEYACLGREDALHTRSYSNTTNGEKESYLNVIRRVIRAAPEMLNEYDEEFNTPIDMLQLIKVDTSTVSKEYERLDEICTRCCGEQALPIIGKGKEIGRKQGTIQYKANDE
jgi:hypothetical protein